MPFSTLDLQQQGARQFPAIPEPQPDIFALTSCTIAVRKCLEILISLVTTNVDGTNTDKTQAQGLTQAQVLTRISVGV